MYLDLFFMIVVIISILGSGLNCVCLYSVCLYDFFISNLYHIIIAFWFIVINYSNP